MRSVLQSSCGRSKASTADSTAQKFLAALIYTRYIVERTTAAVAVAAVVAAVAVAAVVVALFYSKAICGAEYTLSLRFAGLPPPSLPLSIARCMFFFSFFNFRLFVFSLLFFVSLLPIFRLVSRQYNGSFKKKCQLS